ncbi:MAG: hypothetical protein EBS20_05280 [Actinobacteria bacterium]|nr:hypothetical protein [Actinomycetota bacterium]
MQMHTAAIAIDHPHGTQQSSITCHHRGGRQCGHIGAGRGGGGTGDVATFGDAEPRVGSASGGIWLRGPPMVAT